MAKRRTLIGVFVVALAMTVAVAPASAVQPKSGSWFSKAVDPDDEDNLSSIQFRVASNRKKLTSATIYWRCGDESGYYNFKNLPIPIAIAKERFKLVGEIASPNERTTRDFTLKGKFTSPNSANYSMQVRGCGPKTTGKLTYAGS